MKKYSLFNDGHLIDVENLDDTSQEDFISNEISEGDNPNDIFLYGGIHTDNMLILTKKIKYYSERWVNFMNDNKHIIENGKPKPINIYLQSNGGDLYAVLPVIDYIKSSKININTHVNGIASSAASLIAVSGNHRTMTRNSFMLIHELRTQIKGTYSNLIDESVNCDVLMKQIKQIYLNNSKLKPDELDSLLKKDIILNSEQCKSYGLIDEIIG